MKRVCVVNPGLRVGGVERKIADIAEHISEHYTGAEVQVDLILEDRAAADANENLFLELARQSALHIYFKPAHGVPFFFTCCGTR